MKKYIAIHTIDHLYWEDYNWTRGRLCGTNVRHTHSVLHWSHLVLLFKIREETLNCKDEISSLEYFSEERKEMDSEQVLGKLKVCLKSMHQYIKYHVHAVETKTMPPLLNEWIKKVWATTMGAREKRKGRESVLSMNHVTYTLVSQTVIVWQLFPVLCMVELLWNTSFHIRGRRGWTQC